MPGYDDFSIFTFAGKIYSSGKPALGTDNVFLPFGMGAAFQVFGNLKVETAVGLARRLTQQHIRFRWRAVAFLDVAANASSHHIFPSIAPTTGAR